MLPIGREHNNPILDTRMYEEKCKESHKVLLGANVIREHVCSSKWRKKSTISVPRGS